MVGDQHQREGGERREVSRGVGDERRDVRGGRRLRTNQRIKADPERLALRFAPIIPTPGRQEQKDLLKSLNQLALNIKFRARQDNTVRPFLEMMK